MTPPNYKKNVGRLATDRYDFQGHFNGTSFRHNATEIDLFPTVVISGIPKTTVQDAIAALVGIVTPPVIPDATTLSKGIIQLNQDLGGNALNPKVIGLQGISVNTVVPSDQNVLLYSAGSGSWGPAVAPNQFIPGTDLGGSNTSQKIVNISGDAITNKTTISAVALNFTAANTTPQLSQLDNTSANGYAMVIKAQNTTNGGSTGGNLVLAGGSGTNRGGVTIRMNAGEDMLSFMEPVSNQRVAAFFNSFPLLNTDMPVGTGDQVIYIRNANVAPTSGVPVNGAILYANAGTLNVRQTDGVDFPIGSLANPTIWGPATAQTYSTRTTIFTTTTNISAGLFSKSIAANLSFKIDAIVVGKKVGSTDTAQYNMSMGYANNGGSLVAIGSTTISDIRKSGGASVWADPSFTTSSTAFILNSGNNAATNINWFAVIQITILSA